MTRAYGTRNQQEAITANTLAARPDEKILQRKRISLWNDALYRLIRSTNARVGLCIVAFLTLTAIVAVVFWPYNPRIDSDLSNRLKPPSWAKQPAGEKPGSSYMIFGTDDQGRDVFRRVVHGAPISLVSAKAKGRLSWRP